MQTLEKDCKNIIKIQEENYPETKKTARRTIFKF